MLLSVHESMQGLLDAVGDVDICRLQTVVVSRIMSMMCVTPGAVMVVVVIANARAA